MYKEVQTKMKKKI